MRPVRFGLIGYGKVAQLHAQALKEAANAQLVSVCGRTKARRDAFADTWEIASRMHVEEMVMKDNVEAVIITTPHPRHKADTLSACSAGCHVLVEKPMAITTSDCDEMISAAASQNLLLGVVSQRRWYPSCARIRSAINQGSLGTPSLAQVTILGWRDEAYYASDPWRGRWDTEGGGVLINQAPHQIDLMCWYMGEPECVLGFWDNYTHPYIEVEDSAAAIVRFSSGAMASLLLSNSQKPGIYAKVHIHGSSGASCGVQTDGGAMFVAGSSGILEPPYNDIWTIEEEKGLIDAWKREDEQFFNSIDPTTYFFTRQIEDFCNALHTGASPLCTGEDGRRTVQVIEGIYQTGREYVSR